MDFDTKSLQLLNWIVCGWWIFITIATIAVGRLGPRGKWPNINRVDKPSLYWPIVGVFCCVVIAAGATAMRQKGKAYDCSAGGVPGCVSLSNLHVKFEPAR